GMSAFPPRQAHRLPRPRGRRWRSPHLPSSDQIQPSPRSMGPAACGGDPGDDKSGPAGTESIRQAHRVAQPENLVVAELDDPVARGAVKGIVRGITIIVL